MLSETLVAGLEDYRIGDKVRALRLKKSLGLVQLGEHTGLSPALLSKIERGRLFPTLPTLLRIAMVFNVGLEHFFVEETERPAVSVVRKKDRLRLPGQPGEASPTFFFESLDYPATDRKMEAFYAEFRSGAKPSEPHEHQGAEFIFVLNGQLVVNVDGEETSLNDGDSMYFDPAFVHSYRAKGRTSCSAIVVVTA